MNLPTKLMHYSGDTIEKLDPEFHKVYRIMRDLFHKPIGLWFSVEDHPNDETWKTWCEAEEFRLDELKLKYLIKLKMDANIILLDTPEKIVQFGVDNELKDHSILPKFEIPGIKYIPWLDWKNIMERADGIIIAPYQNSCIGYGICTWYWGWDCSSGCIWNINCIEKFELMNPENGGSLPQPMEASFLKSHLSCER